MGALLLILAALAAPAGAGAEAIWCDGRAPAKGTLLDQGRRVTVAPGERAPACLNVPLPVYRKPFPLYCAAQPAGTSGAWCDASKGACGRSGVSLLRHDKGRLATAKDVRYCASFLNKGARPATVWLARPRTTP